MISINWLMALLGTRILHQSVLLWSTSSERKNTATMDSWKPLLSGMIWLPLVKTFHLSMGLKEMNCLNTWSRHVSMWNFLLLFTFHFSKTNFECIQSCVYGRAVFSPPKKEPPSRFGLNFTESKKNWNSLSKRLRQRWNPWNVQNLKKNKK